MWLIYALLSAVFAAATSLLAKAGIDGVNSHLATAIRTAVVFFYLANEGLSCLENAAVIGLPVPDKLKEMLAQLKEEKKNKDE